MSIKGLQQRHKAHGYFTDKADSFKSELHRTMKYSRKQYHPNATASEIVSYKTRLSRDKVCQVPGQVRLPTPVKLTAKI